MLYPSHSTAYVAASTFGNTAATSDSTDVEDPEVLEELCFCPPTKSFVSVEAHLSEAGYVTTFVFLLTQRT
jgi:hypothetical protein